MWGPPLGSRFLQIFMWVSLYYLGKSSSVKMLLRNVGIDARKYAEGLESATLDSASIYGVKAHTGVQGDAGIWIEDRKLGAAGVRISLGITSHR